MKRMAAILLTVLMVISLAACGGEKESAEERVSSSEPEINESTPETTSEKGQAEAPRIINTFVESYDFVGKTIVPFCTSGGSGVGSSATNLEALTYGATWLSGTRLNGGSSRETIVDWVNGLGLDIKAE